MKKILPVLTLVLSSFAGMAQVANPVQWTFSSKKIADKTYELRMTATIGGKYHIYSQNNKADEGPGPTTITYTKNPLLTVQGKAKEIGKLISKMEEVWGFKVNYYENKVEFVQTVKSKVAAAATVKGNIEYIVCDDRQCLPPKTAPFEIKIGG